MLQIPLLLITSRQISLLIINIIIKAA